MSLFLCFMVHYLNYQQRDMLKYYGGFKAGEKSKAGFPHEQHHYLPVCLDCV
jgi:hypothetical protein